MPRCAGPLLGAGVVIGAMAGLHVLGAGVLAAPPTASGRDLLDWASATEPTVVGMVTLRLLALAMGYHLIATTALGVIGHLLRRPGLVRLAEWSTLPPFRSTVRRIAGIGLSASAALLTPLQGAGANGAGAATHLVSTSTPSVFPGQATTVQRGPALGSSTATLRLVNGQPEDDARGQATLRPVDPDAVDAGEGTADQEDVDPLDDLRPEAPPPASTPPESTPTAGLERHTVVPGDHLWAIAEASLAARLGRPPTDAEIDPYWRAVVAANTDLTDPDLLMPGSVVDVPAPPA